MSAYLPFLRVAVFFPLKTFSTSSFTVTNFSISHVFGGNWLFFSIISLSPIPIFYNRSFLDIFKKSTKKVDVLSLCFLRLIVILCLVQHVQHLQFDLHSFHIVHLLKPHTSRVQVIPYLMV